MFCFCFEPFQVLCQVRTRYLGRQDWTMKYRSKSFFAGIKVTSFFKWWLLTVVSFVIFSIRIADFFQCLKHDIFRLGLNFRNLKQIYLKSDGLFLCIAEKKTQTHKWSVSQELVPVRHLRISHNSPCFTTQKNPPSPSPRQWRTGT